MLTSLPTAGEFYSCKLTIHTQFRKNSPPNFGSEVSRWWWEKKVTLVMHPYTHNSVKLTLCMMAMKWADDEERKKVIYSAWSCIHTHTQFSKTHPLMLAKKWADDEERKVTQVMHPYTHNSVKLTMHLSWWQWSEPMMRREKSYSGRASIHTSQFSKTHLLMLAIK